MYLLVQLSIIIYTGVVLKIILIALVIGLGMQTAHIYMTINAIHNIPASHHYDEKPQDDGNQGLPATLLPTTWQQDVRDQIKLIVYSYPGVEALPLGDLISEVLSEHPEIFYISNPAR